ncbi:MAG: hypothetical protein IPM92_16500 [Saprospiraceae bacterium]|nr:hypothetical protein [Saprospiraceae bacterium]
MEDKSYNWHSKITSIEQFTIKSVQDTVLKITNGISENLEKLDSLDRKKEFCQALIKDMKQILATPIYPNNVSSNVEPSIVNNLIPVPQQVLNFLLAELEWLNSLKNERLSSAIFSVIEWATIFYYADDTNLLPDNRMIKNRMLQFMRRHHVNTTISNFKTKFYEAKKRINERKDYPIKNLN